MKKLLICAAIPHEFKYIRRNLSSEEAQNSITDRVLTAQTTSMQITLLQTGIGIHNAESSMGSLLKTFRPDFIVSLGFGGALHEGLAAGDLVQASKFIFLRSGSKVALSPPARDIYIPESNITDIIGSLISLREGSIVTLENPMPKLAIRNILPPDISFPVCDMETFGLAAIAAHSHIPFFGVRAISDTSDQEIPQNFFDLIDASGKTSYSRLLISVLKKPSLIKNLVMLGLNSEKAARSLGVFITSILDNAEKF